jgi:hypothetical protein
LIDTYSDRKIDAFGRSAFYEAMKAARAALAAERPDSDMLEALASVAEAASYGCDDEDRAAPVMGDYDSSQSTGPHNDDALNEIARDVWFIALSKATELVAQGRIMPERISAFARVASAAATLFKSSDESDE